MHSIQARLLVLGLAVVIGVGAVTAWLGYRRAVHEVDELVDAQLVQYARIMLALNRVDDDDEIEFPDIGGHHYKSRILFQIWQREHDERRLLLTSPGAGRSWPAGVAREGYSEARIGDRDWRCFAAGDGQDDHRIWVGLDLRIRDELSRDIAFNNVKPYAFGLPVLAVLLVLAIRSGLAPLRRMEVELGDRSPERLDPLEIGSAPAELQPLVRIMNGLFRRMASALDNERRFTSDAAHELRTPLAALRVQLQVAQRAGDDGERQAAIGKALRGAERMSHLVGQLLALARLEGTSGRQGFEVFDLSALVDDALREMASAIACRKLKVECDIEPDSLVSGNPQLVSVLARNLLDNAVRYGSEGGRLAVGLHHEGDRVVLAVADDGTGVTAEQRTGLGSRFKRFAPQASEGVGLGLSIVKRIVELHDATLMFDDGIDGRGLRVSVAFLSE